MRAREIRKPSFSNALRIFYKHLPKPFMVIENILLEKFNSAKTSSGKLLVAFLVAVLKKHPVEILEPLKPLVYF